MLMKEEWSAERVRADLVEAVKLSWRLPSASAHVASAWASDAPFYLMSRLDRAGSAIDAWRQEQDEVRERRGRALATVPLTAEQVDWVHSRFDWLTLIADGDRKLVRLAVVQLAHTGNRVDWAAVRAELPLEVGHKGLYRRFMRAMRALADRLNEGERRRAA